ncbi:MAG TPA: deoxyribodipyrimidine photo-lyase [Roseiflexaceae bacterium]|nr:deoxyribodipyrimidine photo-lyase [Roseiflexaceae bacterium]
MIIHWFRRDLRLRDNPALDAALRGAGGRVVPLFVLDDALLGGRVGPARLAFLRDTLCALDADLRARGSRLILRRGPPADVLSALVEETGATGLHFNRDYTPFARARDAQMRAALAGRVALADFNDLAICEPDALFTKAGNPYTVYTPYRRKWQARVETDRAELLAETPLPPFAPPPAGLASLPLAALDDLAGPTPQALPPGGESAGLARLAAFAEADGPEGIVGYHTRRDQMALSGTSRLSVYLHFGCVSVRACLRAALRAAERAGPTARDGVETWVGELAWRDFYTQILYHFPHVLRGAYKPELDALAWENRPDLFDAWQRGCTGYPIVDAAMRQLQAEAWMHNRARMIVGSFLVKDLLVSWRWGERHFLRLLVDADHAANNGGWQWVASTGADAQPYFRIFNPVSQGQKFDPRGEYVRRYVPELRDVPERYIHAPWTMPPDQQRRAGVQIGRDYPAPVVDHADRRDRALAMYRAARCQRPEA